jgi:hypothetical protein
VLSQILVGQVPVIAYYSKTLNKAERNYYVTRRELLAIMRTLEHFLKYLCGKQFHLRTDHSALTWLMRFKNLEGLTARWIQRLQEYNFTSVTILMGFVLRNLLLDSTTYRLVETKKKIHPFDPQEPLT